MLACTSPCVSACSCFPLFFPTWNYRAGSGALQWLRSKAAQCLQLTGCNSLKDMSGPISLQEPPVDENLKCAWKSMCDSYVSGWGKLQVLDSHRVLDFLPGQTRVNFNNHEGYLSTFEGLITHEADKFKLYLLPSRLALCWASAKQSLSSTLVSFPLEATQVPVLARMHWQFLEVPNLLMHLYWRLTIDSRCSLTPAYTGERDLEDPQPFPQLCKHLGYLFLSRHFCHFHVNNSSAVYSEAT